MGESLTDVEKFSALMDLVYNQPFTRSLTTDVDGNKRVSYVVSAGQEFAVGGIPQVGPTMERLMSAINAALVGPLLTASASIYRKFAIARAGLNDYIANTETSTPPGTAMIWEKIRENTRGIKGEPGEDTSTTETP